MICHYLYTSIFSQHKEVLYMELFDTIELMKAPDYKSRFKAEYYQLDIRCRKLSDMLTKYRNGTLPFTPTCSIEVLSAQLKCMEQYRSILQERAEIEHVEL